MVLESVSSQRTCHCSTLGVLVTPVVGGTGRARGRLGAADSCLAYRTYSSWQRNTSLTETPTRPAPDGVSKFMAFSVHRIHLPSRWAWMAGWGGRAVRGRAVGLSDAAWRRAQARLGAWDRATLTGGAIVSPRAAGRLDRYRVRSFGECPPEIPRVRDVLPHP